MLVQRCQVCSKRTRLQTAWRAFLLLVRKPCDGQWSAWALRHCNVPYALLEQLLHVVAKLQHPPAALHPC